MSKYKVIKSEVGNSKHLVGKIFEGRKSDIFDNVYILYGTEDIDNQTAFMGYELQKIS